MRAAAHCEHRSRHVAAVVAEQERDGVGHVLGLGDAADRRSALVAFKDLVGSAAERVGLPAQLTVLHGRPHVHRADAVDPDAPRGELGCRRLDQARDRELRRAVGREQGRAPQAEVVVAASSSAAA